MQSLYPNLPGFRTEFRDWNLDVATTVAVGPKILIMGTATDGPVGTPVDIAHPEDAERIFGRAVDERGRPNGATLLPKFYEVYYGGGRNIALMRISGEVASNALAAAAKQKVVRRENSEILGIAAGNSETTFELPGLEAGDELTAVNVISNGRELPSSAFRFAGHEVTILENQTDAGADIAIEFTYTKEEIVAVRRKVLQALNTEYKTFSSPDGETNWVADTIRVWKNGEEITDQTEMFSIDTAKGTITFNAAVEADDVIEAAFEHTTKTVVSDFATGITVAGEAQEMMLEFAPIASTFKLFANGYDVPREWYLLDTANKKVTLLPGFVQVGARLTVSYEYEATENVVPFIRVNAAAAGSLYNKVLLRVEDLVNASGTVYGKKIVIIKPESKKTSEFEPPLEFTSTDYPTFGELVEAVNESVRNNVVVFETEFEDEPTDSLHAINNMYLNGGKDGLKLSKQEMWEKLSGKYDDEGNIVEYGAYHLLDNYKADYYLIAGVYADDDAGTPNKRFADAFCQFLAVQSLRNNECRGGMAVRPPKRNDLPSVIARVNELAQAKARGDFSFYMKNVRGEYMHDDQGRLIDIGRHLDLVAFPTVRVSNQVLGAYSTTAEGLYAGLQASLSSASDTTNKVLPGALKLDFELSAALHDTLSAAGFVTFYWEPGRGAVVTNGVTAANAGSDYRNLPNIRIAIEAAQRVRRVSRKYEGEPYSMIKKNAHVTDIQAELDAMVDEGKLTDFSFTIHQSLKDRVLHNAVILLDLVPAFALKSITMPVSLRPSL